MCLAPVLIVMELRLKSKISDTILSGDSCAVKRMQDVVKRSAAALQSLRRSSLFSCAFHTWAPLAVASFFRQTV